MTDQKTTPHNDSGVNTKSGSTYTVAGFQLRGFIQVVAQSADRSPDEVRSKNHKGPELSH